MAGQGVTLVLRTSWFNRSSWIRAKKIAAISVYDSRAFTSPRISDFRSSIQIDLIYGWGGRWRHVLQQLWELLGKVEAAEMATGAVRLLL
ncbi:hypothetical protein BHE74_00055644 [Ensete ventricosum]|nr:hypothetical protein GW17_00008637 [Ensete ventricosum]RWW39061.1 hypothetical protein BHE74_00055644 [Ensete ventricosum]RZS17852.1 hypothetical protein BHM03_00050051 [Ensete ventricosum]